MDWPCLDFTQGSTREQPNQGPHEVFNEDTANVYGHQSPSGSLAKGAKSNRYEQGQFVSSTQQ